VQVRLVHFEPTSAIFDFGIQVTHDCIDAVPQFEVLPELSLVIPHGPDFNRIAFEPGLAQRRRQVICPFYYEFEGLFQILTGRVRAN
jgi:hypothetical protein